MAAPSTRDTTDIARELGNTRPEVAIPGFWDTLGQNCAKWASEISAGPLWTEARTRLPRWRTEYRGHTQSALLASTELPDFVAKTAESTKRKLLGRCRANKDYLTKAFPKEGPPIPRLGDLVRTRIVCRYIDGVEFLASQLLVLAKDFAEDARRRREGRVEGYFAQHITFLHDGVYHLGGGAQTAKVPCEIQIATELATRMWDASHPFYEVSRERTDRAETWQWDPSDPRFIANQLGHMIHLADGLLVQLRTAREK